jgi:hypothetical protein
MWRPIENLLNKLANDIFKYLYISLCVKIKKKHISSMIAFKFILTGCYLSVSKFKY